LRFVAGAHSKISRSGTLAMTLHPGAAMNPSQQAPTVILAAIDGTPASTLALDTATILAARLDQADLHVVHVVGPLLGFGGPEAVPDPSLGDLMEGSRELLADARALCPYLQITTHSVVGTPALEIVRLAKDVDADVIVVGSHNRTAGERWLLGSVSEQVVRKAGCAVVVARPKAHGISEPKIEPPCEDCIDVQRATAGRELWCERHSERHVHGHVYYETPPTFGVGSTFLRPER
jgi:nucleotide-binding universal stress UspA family protein